MSGLVLKLGPKERVLINGAVIENGDRRSRLSVVTPNDAEPNDARLQLMRGIEQLSQVLTDDDSRALLNDATEAVQENQFYQSLKALRSLMPREDRLLAAARAQ